MKSVGNIKGISLEFDTEKIVEFKEVKLENRRVYMGHDGKNYVWGYKHLTKDGKIKSEFLTFTPEAMSATAYLFLELNGPLPNMENAND